MKTESIIREIAESCELRSEIAPWGVGVMPSECRREIRRIAEKCEVTTREVSAVVRDLQREWQSSPAAEGFSRISLWTANDLRRSWFASLNEMQRIAA